MNGELAHLTRMYMAGYKLNNGSMQGLLNIQKYAVLVMKKHSQDYLLKNDAFLVTD